MTFPESHHCVFKNSVPNSTQGVQPKRQPWELYVTMAVIRVVITVAMYYKWTTRAYLRWQLSQQRPVYPAGPNILCLREYHDMV